MELVVDLATGGVVLCGHRDLGRLSVQALPTHAGDGPDGGALGALAAALSVHHVGVVGPEGDVLVPADALHRLAEEAARQDGATLDGGWESQFAGMVEYATAQGWTAADGSLRAHVEWSD